MARQVEDLELRAPTGRDELLEYSANGGKTLGRIERNVVVDRILGEEPENLLEVLLFEGGAEVTDDGFGVHGFHPTPS